MSASRAIGHTHRTWCHRSAVAATCLLVVTASACGQGGDQQQASSTEAATTTTADAATPPAPPPAPAPTARTYTVASKDTLWAISKQFYGEGGNYQRIADANGIKDPDLIYLGQVLTIP